jgi:hypothetical protein
MWLNNICTENKIYGIQRARSVRTKILIDNKIIEQVKSFNCLRNISYKRALDIEKN